MHNKYMVQGLSVIPWDVSLHLHLALRTGCPVDTGLQASLGGLVIMQHIFNTILLAAWLRVPASEHTNGPTELRDLK